MNRPATIAPLVDEAPEPLREYIARLERAAGDDFRVDRIGGSHSGDPESSHRAALENFPRSGNQRRRVLEALAARKTTGATFEDLIVDTGIKSAAKRLTELKAGGWAIATNTSRKTSMGATAEVYLASDKALHQLEAERTPHQAAGGGVSSPPSDQATRDQGNPSAQLVAAPPALTEPEPISLFGDEPQPGPSTSPYQVEAA